MRKDSISSVKSVTTAALLVLALWPSTSVTAQQDQLLSKRDSIGYTINIDILHKHFLITGDLYKIRKYKLQSRSVADPDSLFNACITSYMEIFESLPDNRQQYFLSKKFYEEIIPVIQYFRNAFQVNRLEADFRKLYPKAAEPDPKHHDHDLHSKHSQQEHPLK